MSPSGVATDVRGGDLGTPAVHKLHQKNYDSDDFEAPSHQPRLDRFSRSPANLLDSLHAGSQQRISDSLP
eukprot:COSAG01_NODE_11087_length_2010_cov_174.792255_4_plen_69_part_01